DDLAGNSGSAARKIGTVDEPTQRFSDYLSDDDVDDFYKFSTVAGGPFVLHAALSGIPDGADFTLLLYKDANNDAVLTDNEIIASSRQPGNFDEDVTAANQLAASNYYVRVQHVAGTGEGPYKLSLSSQNKDLAGNTPATAKFLIGGLFGRQFFDDALSSTDNADIFKFPLSEQTVFDATLTTTSGDSSQISMTLFKDTNGN